MKNLSYFSNFYKIQKKRISLDKVVLSTRTYLKLTTREFEDFSNISNILASNFKTVNSSQIYTSASGEVYKGYLELKSKSFGNAEKERIVHLIRSYAEENKIFLQNINVDVSTNFSNEYSSLKKCSVFSNNKKLAGVVECPLYYFESKGGFKRIKNHRNDDYGYFIDRLEKYKETYEIIELVGEGAIQQEDKSTESVRINKMINLIRESNIIKNKLISVRTKNIKTAETSLQEGSDIINDPTGGTFDPNLIRMVGQNNVPFVLSAFANQQRINTLKTKDNKTNNKTNLPIDIYIESIKRRLDFCSSQNILNSNIAIDLNLDMFTNNFLLSLYTNIDKVKSAFDNILIGSYNAPLANHEHSNNLRAVLEHLITNKINLIRYNEFSHNEEVTQCINELKAKGEDLGQIHKIFKTSNKIETVEQIPRYQFSLRADKEFFIQDKLIDESMVKKEDELSLIIKKYENVNKKIKTK